MEQPLKFLAARRAFSLIGANGHSTEAVPGTFLGTR
jgi:hypothetical protein